MPKSLNTSPELKNPSKIIPKGPPVKARKPKFPTPNIKPQKVAVIKPSKPPSIPKLKQTTVSYARTTKAR